MADDDVPDKPRRTKPSYTVSGAPPHDGHWDSAAPAPVNEATGQARDYWVLPPEERAKGFVRPVRKTYVHDRCGGTTSMATSIAETYARDPAYYGTTFCHRCKAHFPVGEDGEFTWADGSGEKVGT